MAIFMASTKTITRSKGQSAVAAACYRTADKIVDERYGKTQDYTKRSGVMSADIIMPTALKNTVITRSELWNLAERSENRKNSRVAREWLISLPHELDEVTRKALAHNFAQSLADKFGVITDCAIHQPTDKEIEKGADARNFHAHIMLTTRKADLDANGKIQLTGKSDCELSDTDRKKFGLSRAKDEVKEIRELWEILANAKLEEQDHLLIDSRSYKSQGIGLRAQIKLGKDATHMERKGISTDKGDMNRSIAERNQRIWRHQLRKNKRINMRIAENARKNINDRRKLKAETNDDTIRRVERNKRSIEWASKNSQWASNRLEWSDKKMGSVKQRLDDTEREAKKAQSIIDGAVGQRAIRVSNSESTKQRITDLSSAIARSQSRIDDTKSELEEAERVREHQLAARVKIDAIKHNAEFIAHVVANFDRFTEENRHRHRGHYYDREQWLLLNSFTDDIYEEMRLGSDWQRKLNNYMHYSMSDEFIEKHYDLLIMAQDPESDREHRAELAANPTAVLINEPTAPEPVEVSKETISNPSLTSSPTPPRFRF